MTTVDGGDHGIKLFIKHKTIEMVYAYEDSDWEIQSISIIKFYTQQKKQQATANFREIKMYGTTFNYTGFCLQALIGKTPDACVPQYILITYNNPKETNPRKRLAKLTMDKILQELNMKTIDEGCSIAQVSPFCDIHKITCYALDLNTSCLKPTIT